MERLRKFLNIADNPKKLQDRLLSALEEGETVLWQGKPDMKIYFREEKGALFFGPLIFYLVGSTFVFLISGQSFVYPFYSLIFIGYFCEYILWLDRKKNTLFAITDRRMITVFMDLGAHTDLINLRERRLNELIYFEVRRESKGGNLHLGKKRFRNGEAFFYQRYNDERDENDFRSRSFRAYMNSIQYFTFFDLSDVDTPATLIKKYTNAVEYIDLKQRAREEKMKKRAEGKHEER